MPPLARTVFSWLLISWGVLVGISALILLGFRLDYLNTPQICFLGLIGIVPIVASLTAVRNQKNAAVLFLFVRTIPFFCLLYYEARRNQVERAELFSDAIIFVFLLFVGPGLFWLVIHRLHWPPAMPPRQASLRRKLAIVLLQSLVVYLIVSVGALTLIASTINGYSCGDFQPPFARQEYPGRSAFTARVMHVGTVPHRETWTVPSFDRFGRRQGTWALAVVQESFFGTPWWNHKLVILTQNIFADGEVYFIDGERRTAFLTLGLPVVEIRGCGLSAPVNDAEVELRVLRDGPPRDGVRIIGRVVRYVPTAYRDEVQRGVPVVITGPSGSVTAHTDERGIYDVARLPPGAYTIRADVFNERLQTYPECSRRRGTIELAAGDVSGCTLRIN